MAHTDSHRHRAWAIAKRAIW